jgi:PBSX family phage terminase large subunit
MKDKDGLVMLIGNTKGTLQRNIIEPLQSIWTPALVSDIKSDNTAYMFGQKVHCLGGDKISQVDKLRGSSIKYCYGDEVVTWDENVFQMLKSRMDKAYSTFDGTCNPEYPTHWFKQFIDSDADIFRQDYTIYDNDFLAPEVVKALEQEYAGSVFFDRYILGKWTLAEGLIYDVFASNAENYMVDAKDLPPLAFISCGIDFGGNGSDHAFVASGLSKDMRHLYVLRSESIKAKGMGADGITNSFIMFCDTVREKYGDISYVFADSAEQALINTMNAGQKYRINNSIKNLIIDRIRCEILLLNTDRLHIVKDGNDALIDGLKNARWNEKKMKDERLDDGSSNIDILDAFEYSWEYWIKRLLGG